MGCYVVIKNDYAYYITACKTFMMCAIKLTHLITSMTATVLNVTHPHLYICGQRT